MRIAIFGLTVTSSWGNGHATLWRGLLRALARDGHSAVFFERDVPYYARHRDLLELSGCDIVLYGDWAGIEPRARAAAAECDVAMVTSYCADALAATALVLSSRAGVKAFYDLDAPVTLERLSRGEEVSYVGPQGYRGFDLVLSYSGGEALTQLRERLGAAFAAPLYGSVDPQTHYPVAPVASLRSDFSYLGTYAQDRQPLLQSLFLDPAARRKELKFLIGGAQYPRDFPWTDNVWYREHVPPPDHPAFFSSSRLTLNITRAPMARLGFCPSGRLFEAAACGTAVVSDWFEGLDAFLEPDQEVLIARDTEDVLDALYLSDRELERLRAGARERVLGSHTAQHRARELVALLERAGAAKRSREEAITA